ncbi:MAG: VCBS repeat-containing protein [Phycisphaerae bacterium]|nr:VCBS repeat-containing protein [Phycisphaerae bacterium]
MRLPFWKIGLFCAALWGAAGANCGGTALPFPKTAFWTIRTVNDDASIRPAAVAVADFDGDDLLDVVAGYPGVHTADDTATAAVFIFFRADGDNFTAVQLASSDDLSGLAAVAVADMDADEHSDIIAACDGRLVYLHSPADPRQAADWTFSTIEQSTGEDIHQWNDVAVGDIDRQGGPDIVACNADIGRLCWFQSPADPTSGTGWVRVDIDTTTRAGAASIALGNIAGGAGRIDIYSTAPSEATARVAWYQNPSNPVADAWVKTAIGNLSSATRIAVGDLNGDSHDDVVVTNPANNQVGWYIKPTDPTTSWTGYLLTQYASNTPTDVKIADIDGNNQLDVVVATENAGTLRWFTPYDMNDQTLQWGENNLQDLTVNVYRVALGDMDGDNRPDVVAALRGTTTDLDGVAWLENPEP